MAWWIPLAVAGGKMILNEMGGGGKEQPAPQPERMPMLTPIQHEVNQPQELIPLGDPNAGPQLGTPSTAQQQAAPGQDSSAGGGLIDQISGIINPFAPGLGGILGGAAAGVPGLGGLLGGAAGGTGQQLTPEQQMMWVNRMGNFGSTIGRGLSTILGNS